jgi:metal-responsive CopG/Arc/MetJ family transcriptional regulator
MIAKPDQDVERIFTRMPRKLVERIDDFRFSRRIPSRAEAIRRLIEDGLKANGFEATAKLGRAR